MTPQYDYKCICIYQIGRNPRRRFLLPLLSEILHGEGALARRWTLHAYTCRLPSHETPIPPLLLRDAPTGGPSDHLILRRGIGGYRSSGDSIYHSAGAQNGARLADDGSRKPHRHGPDHRDTDACLDAEEQICDGLRRGRQARAQVAPHDARGGHVSQTAAQMGTGAGDGRATAGARRGGGPEEIRISCSERVLG